MSTTRCIQIVSVVGLCLLIAPIRWISCHPPRPQALTLRAWPVTLPPPRSPFEAALRHARWWRTCAREAAKRELEAQESRDPAGTAGVDPEAWRRGLLVVDRGAFLRRARRQAQRAVILARTPREACRAAELMVLIECETGHHRAELQQARWLVALAHGSRRSRTVLRRAERCNDVARKQIDEDPPEELSWPAATGGQTP